MTQPFGNATLPSPAWHPEPKFRGTFSVLSSCLTTMLLCIWTAVHLNLPEHKKEHLQKWRRLGWLVTGLLAPEVVAWNAWQQRREAKALTATMREINVGRDFVPASKSRGLGVRLSASARKIRRTWQMLKVKLLLEVDEVPAFGEERKPSNGPNDTGAEWSDLHSWFTIMGGFAFDTTSAREPFLPEQRERVVLTPEGVIMLAENWPHLLPVVSEQDIKDKSKSDGLFKLVTCWQAAWFIAQCIVRLKQGLSVSLLELNVFGHAICALFIYALWWHKPQDIMEPSKIIGEESNTVAALVTTLSPLGSAARCTPPPRNWRHKPRRYFWTPIEADCPDHELSPGAIPTAYDLATLLEPHSIKLGYNCWTLRCTKADYKGQSTSDSSSSVEHGDLTSPVEAAVIVIDKATSTRLMNIKHRDFMRQRIDNSLEVRNLNTIEKHRLKLPTLVYARSHDWCLTSEAFSGLDSWTLIIGSILANALYGGLHTTAWNAAYRTDFQQLMWRASSFTVALAIPACIVIVCIAMPFVNFHLILARQWTRIFPKKKRDAWFRRHPGFNSVKKRAHNVIISLNALVVTAFAIVGLIVIVFGAIPWYGACRAFLVVESFINLAYLPDSVLQVAKWSQYVPHIT